MSGVSQVPEQPTTSPLSLIPAAAERWSPLSGGSCFWTSPLGPQTTALMTSCCGRTQFGSLEAVSWVEALGWFGGWDYVRKLSDQLAMTAAGPGS